MQISFRHSNYRATLSQPIDDENLIYDFVQHNPLPSNQPILKCVTSKPAIRPFLAADDSDFYDDEHDADEELTEFDIDDEELIVFDDENDEPTVLDEEDVTPYDNQEDPACSTIPNEESSIPDPVIIIQGEPPADHNNKATTSTFYRNNPYKGSSINYQKYSYWTK